MKPIIQEITQSQLKPENHTFKVGDGVRVHTKVREGDKERVQIFAGIVIAHRGSGVSESFTVRRISYGEGVERVFPVNSPNVLKVEIERNSVPMRSRLYYLRDRVGKQATSVKERRFLVATVGEAAETAAPAEAPKA